MKNINQPLTLKDQAIAVLDQYLDIPPTSVCNPIMEEVISLVDGPVTNWQAEAIFARDRIQTLRNTLISTGNKLADADTIRLLDRWIYLYETIHYEPRRQAEFERAIIEFYPNAFDEGQLQDMVELYQLRAKASSIEARLSDKRCAKQNMEAE